MKDVTRKTTLTALAIVAAATLISLPAASQPVRPDSPPRPDRMPLQRPAPDGFRETRFAAEGTVRQYLMNRHGEVDGLLLSDGTQINFPPHMADELVGVVKPDDRVDIQGDRERDSVVKADIITNSRTGQSVAEHAPSWRDRQMPPHLKRLSMNDMQASGAIHTLLYAPQGEVRGFILADGTQIHVRPDVGDGLARTLRVGDTVQAEGYGIENQYGRSLEATAIGLGGGRLVPLDRSMRQLSGPDEPLPPRRK
jgi:hypothetical protein